MIVARRHLAGIRTIPANDAHELCRRIDVRRRLGVDAERVVAIERAHREVVQMDVLARRDVAAREADDLVVAPHRLTLPRAPRRHLVAGRHEPETVTFSSISVVPPTNCWRAMTTSSAGCRRIVERRAGKHVFLLQPFNARSTRARHGRAFDRVEIPVDPQARRLRRYGVAIVECHAGCRDRVELRDVFDPRAVRHGGGE